MDSHPKIAGTEMNNMTKYEILERRRLILKYIIAKSLEGGDLLSINEIAADFDISTSTASYAINMLEREGKVSLARSDTGRIVTRSIRPVGIKTHRKPVGLTVEGVVECGVRPLCPCCGGLGYVTVLKYVSPGEYKNPRTDACLTCMGSGYKVQSWPDTLNLDDVMRNFEPPCE